MDGCEECREKHPHCLKYLDLILLVSEVFEAQKKSAARMEPLDKMLDKVQKEVEKRRFTGIVVVGNSRCTVIEKLLEHLDKGAFNEITP